MKAFLKKSFLFFCFSNLFYFSDAQIPTPVACFNFSGNLSEANGGTPLTALNGSGNFSYGPTLCGADSFYNWTAGQGLQLSIGTTFPMDNYTIEILFEFTSVPYTHSWQRIIDFKNNTQDLGLYTYWDQFANTYNLQMYTINTGTSNIAQPNTWFRLFLTRSAATDSVKGYLNNNLEISFSDNTSAAVFLSNLILFKDDIAVPNEESNGSVDYLRIYNQPLTQAQISQIVTIAPPPLIIAANQNLCIGDSTQLGVLGGGSDFLWSTGETTNIITVTPTVTTTYYLTSWSYLFCTKTCDTFDSITITVSPCANTPIAVFASSDSSFCEKHCLDFFDLSTNNPTSWQWFFPGADSLTSTLQNPTSICYNTYGNFDVTLIACNANGCDTLILSNFINEYQNPVDSIYISNDTLFSLPAYTYQWYEVTSGMITGAMNQYFVPQQAGSYYCLISDSIGCAGSSNTIVITAINQISNSNFPISVIPNPFTDELTIIFQKQNISKASLAIKNILSQEVYEKYFVALSSKNNFTIDLSFLPKGIYLLEVIMNEEKFTGKILKN